MNQIVSRAFFVVALVLVLAAGDALSCPQLVERDVIAPFRHELAAYALVVEYMTASKNGDAERAAGLIDYGEWTKELGVNKERAEEWAKSHRTALDEGYRRDKAAGSTKAFQIVKATVLDETAVFEVTQERVGGVFLWEVKLKFKEGQWVIIGFRTLQIER